MASVFKREDAKHWFAAYRAADGRRVKVSTKVEDEEEAQRIADRYELEAREAVGKRKASASLSGVNDALQRATQLAVSGRLDAHAARDIVNDLLAAAGHDSLDAVTNRAWCDGWRKSKEKAVTTRTRWKYDQICRDWLLFLRGKADKPLETVARADVIAFRDRLAESGLSSTTANQTVKILRNIYEKAIDEGYLGRNPFAGVDRIRDETADDSKKIPFTTAEVASLVREATDDWKGLILLCASTGLRLMDAARIRWSNFDLKECLIVIKTSKTGAVLKLPIHASVAAWLSGQPRKHGASPLFPTLANKGGAGKSGLSNMFKRLMVRAKVSAGVARTAKTNGRGRTTSQKSFHSLRHYASTQLAQNGVRAEVARSITGHADAEAHAGYITADLVALRAAVATIALPE